ncbi:MAG: glycine cleavage system protein GcvH [Phycisphaerae bacterium]|nr:glycine cleavage system protein GcvH [Phycisphaerae bacterium]
MASPDDRKYSDSHEWFLADGDTVTMGITKFAADELTDVTFVDLPGVGARVTAGQPFGEIESVKATGELNTVISGEVVEVNERLADEPELVNSSPFDDGWMIRVKADSLDPLGSLKSAAAYDEMTSAG